MPGPGTKGMKVEWFLIGFVVGVLVALTVIQLLPRLFRMPLPSGMTEVGSVSYDGLHVTVYMNFTERGGIPYIDTVYVEYYWSYGLPAGQGQAYCKLAQAITSSTPSQTP